MTTVINNPAGQEDSGSGIGLMLGIIVTIAVIAGIVLFSMYGLPKMQNSPNPGSGAIDINVKVPDIKITTPAAPAATPAVPAPATTPAP